VGIRRVELPIEMRLKDMAHVRAQDHRRQNQAERPPAGPTRWSRAALPSPPRRKAKAKTVCEELDELSPFCAAWPNIRLAPALAQRTIKAAALRVRRGRPAGQRTSGPLTTSLAFSCQRGTSFCVPAQVFEHTSQQPYRHLLDGLGMGIEGWVCRDDRAAGRRSSSKFFHVH